MNPPLWDFLLTFHILVLLKILPADMIWGGQANTNNLIALEVVVIVVTVFFSPVIAAKTDTSKPADLPGQ